MDAETGEFVDMAVEIDTTLADVVAMTPKLNAAVALAMSEMPWVEKRGFNPFHKYAYSTADDIRDAVGKIMGKHGLSVAQHELGVKVLSTVAMVTYGFRLAHSSGEVGTLERVTVMSLMATTKGLDDKCLSKARVLGLKDWMKNRFFVPAGDAAANEEPDAGQQYGRHEAPLKDRLARLQEWIGRLRVRLDSSTTEAEIDELVELARPLRDELSALKKLDWQGSVMAMIEAARKRVAAKTPTQAQTDGPPDGTPDGTQTDVAREENGFSEYLADQYGDLSGEDAITDPVLWAERYVALREGLDEASVKALEEANEGALDLVRAIPEIAPMLDAGRAPAATVLKVPMAGEKLDWMGYSHDFHSVMEIWGGAGKLGEWIEAQRETIERAPKPIQKLVANDVLKSMGGRVERLEAWMRPMLGKPRAVKPAEPVETDAAKASAAVTALRTGTSVGPEVAEEEDDPDQDMVKAASILSDLGKCTGPTEVEAFSRNAALRSWMTRMKTEKPSIFAMVNDQFNARWKP